MFILGFGKSPEVQRLLTEINQLVHELQALGRRNPKFSIFNLQHSNVANLEKVRDRLKKQRDYLKRKNRGFYEG